MAGSATRIKASNTHSARAPPEQSENLIHQADKIVSELESASQKAPFCTGK
jgi:hypothetical protein